MEACQLTNNELKPHSVVCSEHFRDSDYNNNVIALRKLNKEAVPFLKNIGGESQGSSNLEIDRNAGKS